MIPFAQLQRAYSNWSRDIRDTNAERALLIEGGHATRETIEEVIADARRCREAIRQELVYGRDIRAIIPLAR